MLQDYLPYVIIAVVTVALVAATIVLARLAWRRQLRRYLMDLVGRREVIGAGLSSTEAVVRTLAEGDTDDLVAFAQGNSEERTALVEIAKRMRIEAGELERLALPKRLWPLADWLGRAAVGLAAQAGAVGDVTGVASIEELADLDLEAIREAVVHSDEEIRAISDAYRMTDASMYSSGAKT